MHFADSKQNADESLGRRQLTWSVSWPELNADTTAS